MTRFAIKHAPTGSYRPSTTIGSAAPWSNHTTVTHSRALYESYADARRVLRQFYSDRPGWFIERVG